MYLCILEKWFVLNWYRVNFNSLLSRKERGGLGRESWIPTSQALLWPPRALILPKSLCAKASLENFKAQHCDSLFRTQRRGRLFFGHSDFSLFLVWGVKRSGGDKINLRKKLRHIWGLALGKIIETFLFWSL